uniref:Uncharacterized protein n=1 Tax=Setaria digitata TaxID=48799 RepID=A0A915PKX6_9BILA
MKEFRSSVSKTSIILALLDRFLIVLKSWIKKGCDKCERIRGNAAIRKQITRHVSRGAELTYCSSSAASCTYRKAVMIYLANRSADAKATVLKHSFLEKDNRKCCAHLNLADSKLGVGNRCLRFCDPAGQGINTISKSDATCLFNWNVILFCHQSGIPLD